MSASDSPQRRPKNDSPGEWFRLVRDLRRLRQLEPAEQVLLEARSKYPLYVPLLIEESEILMARGKWRESAVKWDILFDRYCGDLPPSAFIRISVTHRRLRALGRALVVLREGSRLHPNEASVLIEYAELLTYMRLWDAAAEVWEKVIRRLRDKAPPSARQKLAWCLKNLGRESDSLNCNGYVRRFMVADEELLLHITPIFIGEQSALFRHQRVFDDICMTLAFGKTYTNVYYTEDMGLNWNLIISAPAKKYQYGFITEERNILLWSSREKRVDLYDLSGRLIASQEAPLPWHGCWGIGQRGDVIMYGEYDGKAEELNIRRSLDGGRTWSAVLGMKGLAAERPEIRHFHMVQPDPFHQGHWYASSGDSAAHCRVWLSKNDGLDWIEVTDPDPVGLAVQSVHRFTAIQFTRDYLFWPTDDLCGTATAQFVKATRGEPLRVEVVGPLESELARALIRTTGGYVCISEAKMNNGGYSANIQFIEDNGNINFIQPIKSLYDKITGFTFSSTGTETFRGSFMAANMYGVLNSETEIYRWRIVKSLDYTLSNKCNLCSEDLQEMVDLGDLERLGSIVDDAQWQSLRANKWEAACPSCQSRIRTRTLRNILHRLFPHQRHRSMLVVSGTTIELRVLREKFESIRNISLYAPEVDPACEIGIDITNMPQIKSDYYDAAMACTVMDYIENSTAAMKEFARILKKGGYLLLHIMPNRLRNDSEPPVVFDNNALAHSPGYLNEGQTITGIPQIVFGKWWIAEKLSEFGFDVEIIPAYDIFSNTRFSWFVARKI